MRKEVGGRFTFLLIFPSNVYWKNYFCSQTWVTYVSLRCRFRYSLRDLVFLLSRTSNFVISGQRGSRPFARISLTLDISCSSSWLISLTPFFFSFFFFSLLLISDFCSVLFFSFFLLWAFLHFFLLPTALRRAAPRWYAPGSAPFFIHRIIIYIHARTYIPRKIIRNL